MINRYLNQLCFIICAALSVSGQGTTVQSPGESSTLPSTRDCVLHRLPKQECQTKKYSSIDGVCNNPLNPYAGAADTPFKRLIQPSYDDGIQEFRRSVTGQRLPAARVISNLLNTGSGAINRNSTVTNGMFVQFAQYMTHDFTSAPVVKINISNCSCSNPSASCINVPIPSDDLHYTNMTKCIPLRASKAAEGCPGLPEEQLNTLTAYVDAGTIYGSSENLLTALRDPSSKIGELLLKDVGTAVSSGCPMHRNKKMLPLRQDLPNELGKTFTCQAHQNSPACFASGEERVNENIGLASTHLLFTREHNRIAKRLNALNPGWDSDTIFYETRRIVIAVHQIITYREFLPLLLGPKLMKGFDLEVVNDGFYYGYDPTYDATISNAFATAAFRYGHSQVGEFYHRPAPDYETMEAYSIPTFKALFQQEAVVNGTSPAIMRGLLIDPAKETDPSFVSDLRNRMFESATKVGEDLFSLNIQRGRQHGLATYNQLRNFCGYKKATQWSHFTDFIPNSVVEKLQTRYRHYDDVDLYVGGISETPLDGAAVGPVFGCIIAYQLRDMKKGDRFWFENPGMFSHQQLQELRKIRLSRILCDNMNGMISVPPRAMELPLDTNTRVDCTALPQLDISSWKESNIKQDGVWSRWIPTEEKSIDVAYTTMLEKYRGSVCEDPLKTEILPISENQPGRYKMRFLCPKGTIKDNKFPNTKASLDCYWTAWMDRDTPSNPNMDDEESFAHLKLERSDLCEHPLYMQAQTKYGKSAYDSSEIFMELSPRYGLVCRGADQVNGTCEDYRVRFYCPNEYREAMDSRKRLLDSTTNGRNSINFWTAWINLGNPRTGAYDLELLHNARSRGRYICRKPMLIEGRVASTKISAESSASVLKRYNIYNGLVCDNRDQDDGICEDFEVRYLCPYSEIPKERNRS